MPCNKIDKQLVVYRFSGNDMTSITTLHMPDSHNFGYYHWIRGYINHARAEIARVEIRYSLFEKKDFSSASTMRKKQVYRRLNLAK